MQYSNILQVFSIIFSTFTICILFSRQVDKSLFRNIQCFNHHFVCNIVNLVLQFSAGHECGKILEIFSNAKILLEFNLKQSSTVTDVMRFFVCLAVMMVYLVVLCFWSDEVTFKFGLINGKICECSWYKFPMKTQRLLPVLLMNVQKPVYIEGYMNVRCTRESVKIVIFYDRKSFLVIKEIINLMFLSK